MGAVKSRSTCTWLGGVVHAYNPSTREAEAADCETGGQSELRSDFQAKNRRWFREEGGEGGSSGSVYHCLPEVRLTAEGTALGPACPASLLPFFMSRSPFFSFTTKDSSVASYGLLSP